MTDRPEPPSEPEPETEPALDDFGEPIVPDPGRRRLRAAVALTLIAAIVVFGAFGGARLIQPSRVETPPEVRPARLAAIDNAGHLAVSDSAGANAVSLSSPGTTFTFPVWSPDGARVAAVGERDGTFGAYVFDVVPAGTSVAVGGEPRVIYQSTDKAPFYLYWAPDGNSIGFLTNQPVGISLRFAPADGSAAGKTIREGAPLYWDWVDAGRLLAHVGGSEPDAFLGEVGLDGAVDGGSVIAPPPSSSAAGSGPPGLPGDFRAPAVSRDGRFRAYVESDGGGQRLVVAARDGSAHQAVAVNGSTAFAFSASGTSLAFIGPADPAGAPEGFPIGPLRLVDVATGTPRTLRDGRVVAFFWSPDGRTIASLEVPDGDNNGNEAVGPIVPAMAVLTGARSVGAGRLAGAGVALHLAFLDIATGAVRSERDVSLSDTFTNQILPYFDQYALSHRFWSADDASIALPLVSAAGVDQLTVIPADGAAPHQVSDRTIGFWSP